MYMQGIPRRSQSRLQPHFRTLGALTCHRGMHDKLAHISCGRWLLSDCHKEPPARCCSGYRDNPAGRLPT
ncbi:hypothetical protein J6590_049071 [Homalodisca vitripennis]|nr:hypothetical protein J6590_049071 [Homalodisca vitripennis]